MGSHAINPETQKLSPLIVLCVWPIPGHTYGLLQVAEFLVKRGFQCFFCGGSDHEAQIIRTGAEFFPHDRAFSDIQRQLSSTPPGYVRSCFTLKHVFLDSVQLQHNALTTCLESVRKRFPARQVIILHESYAMGLLPFYYGAPLPRGYTEMPRVINFHPSVHIGSSIDVGPFPFGLPPATGDEDRKQLQAVYNEIRPLSREVVAYANEVYRTLGATRKIEGDFFLDILLTSHDVTMMTCSPGLEYPRSDMSPKIKFIGGMPLKPIDPNFAPPSWWGEIVANASLPSDCPSRKKVVTVAQGTLHLNYRELIVPTITGLFHQDIILVALLGAKGAQLADDLAIPANTYVIDYLPYDAILPFSDVFISNAGYGGFIHGIMNGVPMVLAGVLTDKAEVSRRAEWAGIGVNLRTQSPSPGQIRQAVDTIFSDTRFKQRVLELKKENEDLNALGSIEKQIWEYTEFEVNGHGQNAI
ncbi:glycosyltransferase family 1 protein [Thozetella sp. PMI_491]|nr:glycosyltransferase family 1 protein [Thozetella sp. PMI_491]